MILTLDNCTEQSTGALKLCYIYGSRRFWIVQEDIVVLLSTGEVIVIESGFKTDLASVPRWLWGFFPPYGDFLFAAIVHDYLYVHNVGTRKSADKEMLIWSVALNPKRWVDNRLRYVAVRLFGRPWWNHEVKFIKQ